MLFFGGAHIKLLYIRLCG